MKSLEARLHLGLGVSLAVLILSAWWLGHAALHHSTEAYVLSHLRHASEALLGNLSRTQGETMSVRPDVLTPVYRQPFSGHYYEILGPDGTRYSSRSLWDERLSATPLPGGSVEQWQTTGPIGQHLLVRSAGYRLGESSYTITVAEDLNPLLESLRGFEQVFSVLAVSGFVLMLLLQRTAVRRTFRRLRPVYRDIEALERGAKQQLTDDVPIEILPLVRKLNALLSVYGKRLERSRNAAGNLAHALKGPLNLMLQQLERPHDPTQQDERERLRAHVNRVKELSERELKRARIAGSGGPGSIFDPSTELPVLKDLLQRMYEDKGLMIDCDYGALPPVSIDREDMLELTGTLLDNACKWASSRVACRLEPTKTGIRLHVEDDGPGCGEAELTAIGARGARLDEQVAGHGLGLSIAQEIVDLYQGRLELGRSTTLGGFGALVELPVQPRLRQTS